LSDTGSILCVGLAIEDTILTVPCLPTGGTKAYVISRHVTGGGPAANAAVAIARLGGRAHFVGRLGDDAVGDRLVAGLEAEGVARDIRRYEDIASPVSTIIVNNAGERIILAYSMPFPVSSAEVALPQDCAVVLADLSWPEAALAVVEAATARGVPSVIDADVTRHPFSVLRPLLDAASHLVFSRAGLTALSETGDIATGLARMERPTHALVAVTDGAAGTYFRSSHGELVNVPALLVRVTDTTAAGDAYHGAFALALARGADCAKALRFATCVAAMKCTRGGGRDGLPFASDLADLSEDSP